MKIWKDVLIDRSTPIIGAIRILDETAAKITLVVDDDLKLLGTVTDGDVRRGILKSLPLSEPVEKIMNPNPHVSTEDESRDGRIKLMTTLSIHQIPIIDARGRVTGLETLETLVAWRVEHNNWVVLMAGGVGSRLRPLTEQTPKPLLEVGGKPLLETILKNFIKHGFHRFYISVNYLSGQFREHFGNGEQWDAEIRYIEEEKRLGTAGALRLIPERPQSPMIVMNGDLLTRVNFQHLLDYHRQHGSKATMCVREYDFQVPFGVVRIEDNRITGIDEKPLHSFFVNAGIYVLDPGLIDLIPRESSYDMTDLFAQAVSSGYSTAAFPIHEYWLDVGRLEDLDRAKLEFDEKFGQ